MNVTELIIDTVLWAGPPFMVLVFLLIALLKKKQIPENISQAADWYPSAFNLILSIIAALYFATPFEYGFQDNWYSMLISLYCLCLVTIDSFSKNRIVKKITHYGFIFCTCLTLHLSSYRFPEMTTFFIHFLIWSIAGLYAFKVRRRKLLSQVFILTDLLVLEILTLIKYYG